MGQCCPRTVSSSVGIPVGTPPPSTVTGISISPNPVVAGQPATITVTGTNPCGMIGIHLDDGETAWLVISQLPANRLSDHVEHVEWGSGTRSRPRRGGCPVPSERRSANVGDRATDE